MLESQKIDSGDGSFNLQARRDIHIYGNPEEDFGILEEIIVFLQKGRDLRTNDQDHLLGGGIVEKISLNFPDDSRKTVEDLFKETYKQKNLVEKFLSEQQGIDEESIVSYIRNLFREIKSPDSNYTAVENVSVLDEMSLLCIPASKKRNPEYRRNALALVLYFFEKCDFGKKKEI